MSTSRRSPAERLRHVEAVTDAALANLETDDLLRELLDRVCEVLETDTAVVLLLDDSGSELVATAARGLEAEVRQGVRIPLAKGFAGRVAAGKQPVAIPVVDHTNVVNPILRERGIRSLLGVPLISSGTVIGVLHVGTLEPRTFTDDDVKLLQVVGDRLALALQAHQAQAERAAVLALQRSLLPAGLPSIAGLEFAARYVPGEAEEVGGDWYDVFVLPDGKVGIAIGDVAGRGLRASVVMGRLRSALRAYALDSEEPHDVITKLDRKLNHFEPGQMATVLYAVLEPALGRMHVTIAGHPPPVIARRGAPSIFPGVEADPPLGLPAEALRRTTTIDVAPETVFCFYTDGLAERRETPIGDRLELLRSVVVADHPHQVCATVMAAMIGSETAADDVALLVMRRVG